MRLFVAIPFSHIQQIRMYDSAEEYRRRFREIKWVRPENLHITLSFLGERDDKGEICRRLRLVKNPCASGKVALEPTAFSSRGEVRVIKLDVEGDDNLTRLAGSIGQCLDTANSMRSFTPHVTLGRPGRLLRGGIMFGPGKKREYLDFKVEYFALMESILKPDGPVYKTVEVFRLGER